MNLISSWREIREFILMRDDNSCQDCGSENNLHIHHQDRDKNNNNPFNLKTLCASCHRKTHHREEQLFMKTLLKKWLIDSGQIDREPKFKITLPKR